MPDLMLRMLIVLANQFAGLGDYLHLKTNQDKFPIARPVRFLCKGEKNTPNISLSAGKF